MDLLVSESMVPATQRSQKRALGRKSYGPSLVIMKRVENLGAHLLSVRCQHGRVLQPPVARRMSNLN